MNFVALIIKVTSEPNSPMNRAGSFFAGYNIWVWAVVILGSGGGMMISFTLKYVDNIAVVFSHALAVIPASTMSTWIFDLSLPFPFVLGGILILISLLIFNAHVEGGSRALSQEEVTTASSSWSVKHGA